MLTEIRISSHDRQRPPLPRASCVHPWLARRGRRRLRECLSIVARCSVMDIGSYDGVIEVDLIAEFSRLLTADYLFLCVSPTGIRMSRNHIVSYACHD